MHCDSLSFFRPSCFHTAPPSLSPACLCTAFGSHNKRADIPANLTRPGPLHARPAAKKLPPRPWPRTSSRHHHTHTQLSTTEKVPYPDSKSYTAELQLADILPRPSPVACCTLISRCLVHRQHRIISCGTWLCGRDSTLQLAQRSHLAHSCSPLTYLLTLLGWRVPVILVFRRASLCVFWPSVLHVDFSCKDIVHDLPVRA